MSVLDFFNTWYKTIVNVDEIDDEFEQELAIVLSKYNLDGNDVDNLSDHVSKLCDWLRRPLTEPLPKFDMTFEKWSELYDELVNLVPFYNESTKTIVFQMKEYLSKIHYSDSDPINVFQEYIGGCDPPIRNHSIYHRH